MVTPRIFSDAARVIPGISGGTEEKRSAAAPKAGGGCIELKCCGSGVVLLTGLHRRSQDSHCGGFTHRPGDFEVWHIKGDRIWGGG